MAHWPYTNQSRWIIEFEGDGDEIWTQGNEVWQLGYRMELAAGTLRELASGDDGQQGDAVDALRKKVGDADDKLTLAAELYKPLGTALKTYGNEVRNTIKSQVDTACQDARDKWNLYDGLPGDKDGTDYFLGIGKPEEGSDEEAEQEAKDQAKLAAWEDWEDAAGVYDTAYDTWEDAWEKAIGTIEDAFSDDLKDSTWEDWKGRINIALEILKWAGLVVGIAALIIGGPIVAAIAAAIAVATLVLTVVMALDGDGSWGDVAWAAVDLIPFGKAGKLFKGDKAGFARDMFANFGTKQRVVTDGVTKIEPNVYQKGWSAVKDFGQSGANKTGWQKWAGEGANTGWQDSVVKSITGKNISDWSDTADGMPGSIYEMYHSKVGHYLKIEGWGNTIYNQVTGDDRESLRNRNPVVKTVW
ncbi:hypothetical protein SAMN04487783_0725 [Agrococcus baldri]|uniref:Uncharacterized protein n=1 Tax=Agrococcus baldri TaxID=153730 RepID=A0AA94HL43_9MICO|nr:hypothetical protein [Agrococcus baldri]SFS03215.1 hypothetical protein SAMN04487783_0725 [Agrococcus baldri]